MVCFSYDIRTYDFMGPQMEKGDSNMACTKKTAAITSRREEAQSTGPLQKSRALAAYVAASSLTRLLATVTLPTFALSSCFWTFLIDFSLMANGYMRGWVNPTSSR